MGSALDFQSKDDGSIPFIHSNKIEIMPGWRNWQTRQTQINLSAMARNPIVESPKFGEILLTFTVHVKKYIEIVQIEGLYTLINNV